MKKFGIYALCIFGCAGIQVFAQYAGVTLGALPTGILFFATLSLARYLCKKYCPEDEVEEEDTEWLTKDENDCKENDRE